MTTCSVFNISTFARAPVVHGCIYIFANRGPRQSPSRFSPQPRGTPHVHVDVDLCICKQISSPCMCAQLSKHKVLLSLREGAGEGGDVMCSQTMMSSVETLQGFKVTKAFFPPTGSVELCIRGLEESCSQAHRGRSPSVRGENTLKKKKTKKRQQINIKMHPNTH